MKEQTKQNSLKRMEAALKRMQASYDRMSEIQSQTRKLIVATLGYMAKLK
jgi:hypothetical protein